MKDILRMMRFDLLSAAPVALVPLIIIVLAMTGIVFLISPATSGFMLTGALLFILPQGTIAEKSDFGKLYGTLPVNRKNITRARFLFIFTCLFAAEVFALVLTWFSLRLQLIRFLPNQEAEFMQVAAATFKNDDVNVYSLTIGFFTIACFAFSFMEMTGQIFGRENDLKVVFIIIGILTVIGVVFSILSDRGIIPEVDVDAILDQLSSIQTPLCIGINIGLLGLNILFGEITANALAKREL
ncbi:MAG: ABC-2 transporter permease [Oscillospiraceae bacterium]|nr:ABC-2 transporter permease [Oscillospiraceae bacterium]